jgi:uncharacterized OB-fold protein
MTDSGYLRPIPEPTPDSRPYWDGLRAGKFLVQRCAACGELRHYPRPLCSGCYSFDVEWIALSGHGTVHSWTVCHHAFLPAFKVEVPYVIVIVDLEGGVRANLPLEGPADQPVWIGMPVEIAYRAISDAVTLPMLVKAKAHA